MKPKVCFGMTLYNNAKHLPEALESLLNQSYEGFHIVAVDDCSTDGTDEIMLEYVKKDKRISYFRNETWHGMIATWRKAFSKAYELHRPYYFAWASDHDIWHKDWLKHHVSTLNKYTNAVLAYPETVPISAKSEPCDMPASQIFETLKMTKFERMYNLCRIMRGAGDKVYGLFRVEPLIKAGVFRFLSMPDRLLLVEIGVHGPFKYIPEKLWQRRYVKPMESGDNFLERQNSYLFGAGDVPFHAWFPYISHSLSLALSLSFYSGNNGNSYSRTGLLMSMMHWEANREKTIENELKKLAGAPDKIYDKHPSMSRADSKRFREISEIFRMLYGDEPSLSPAPLNRLLTGMLHQYSGPEIFREVAGPVEKKYAPGIMGKIKRKIFR